MFFRRSPTAKGKPKLSSSVDDDSNGKGKDLGPSPSRNGSNKPKRKLSCLENGRLCLLRSRGSSIWLVLFLVGAMICAVQEMNKGPDFFSTQRERFKMTHDYTVEKEGSGRILSQPLSSRIMDGEPQQKWQVMTGRSLFQRANYQPKPLMMGFLLVPDRELMSANYFIGHRRTHLRHLELPPSIVSKDVEEFQIVRINHQNHAKVDYKNNAPKRVEAKWKFENTEVAELGTGVDKQEEIRDNSKDYNRFKPDDPPPNCVPQYDWQTLQFPTCNELHALDILTRVRTLNPAEEPESILLARGGYRDVWFVEQNDLPPAELGETVAMKTLLYEHPWTERNMDRHRRDALATDRLRRSPNALDLFGYCGNTGLYEFAEGGSLEDAVDNEREWQKWTPEKKMKYVYQVAKSIADVHNIDKEGLPSMSHTDISMSQFVSTDNGETYKINDFNRARFLYRDKHDPQKLCTFSVSSNKGKFRSPEEYAYRPETQAIDTYSMGNIFFVILTGDYPFPDNSKKDVKELVKKGRRPEIDEKYLHSEDPLEKAILQAMRMCWVQDPEKRSTSREVEQFLKPFATT